ncbi:MAG: acyl-CoA dehydrogenase family protein [Gemmatimonadota bacterium]|nr:acyl-CoA dehydrogenase family protein [Gemmatimonadota bacterium]
MADKKPSFIRQLFAGAIDDAILFPYPAISAEEDRQVSKYIDQLRSYLDANLDRDWIDENERIPEDVLDELRQMGLFGVSLPQECGGMGLSPLAYARVFEFITGYDPGLAILFGVHLSIGIKGIQLAGTPEQKQEYLPRAATGEWMASFALTEPLAGSDAAGIQSRAAPQPDGSYLLNGHKIWIGNGSFSEIIVAFAQVPVEKDGETQDRVTAFILRPDMPGYERSTPPLRKMGARGSNQCELRFHDVRVPPENLLGEPGGGFKLAMQVLNSGRIGLSAGAAGGIKSCLEEAVRFATEREQFGRPIAEYELIEDKLARMAADAYAAESVAYFTAGLATRDDVDYALGAAAAKVWTSDALGRAVDELVQIAGGRGFVKGYPYERAYRDARITRIFEGTNEILRLFIGLSGIEDPGERLQELGAAIRKPVTQIGTLAEYASDRVRLALRQGEPRVQASVHSELRRHFDYLEDHTRELRTATERALRRLGRRIIDRQLVVARLADMAIQLYVRAATLSRTQAILEAHDRGEEQTAPIPEVIPLDDACVQRILRLCDLSAQLSGLRFRAARDSLHDTRDDLLIAVAQDAVGQQGLPYGQPIQPQGRPPVPWGGAHEGESTAPAA